MNDTQSVCMKYAFVSSNAASELTNLSMSGTVASVDVDKVRRGGFMLEDMNRGVTALFNETPRRFYQNEVVFLGEQAINKLESLEMVSNRTETKSLLTAMQHTMEALAKKEEVSDDDLQNALLFFMELSNDLTDLCQYPWVFNGSVLPFHYEDHSMVSKPQTLLRDSLERGNELAIVGSYLLGFLAYRKAKYPLNGFVCERRVLKQLTVISHDSLEGNKLLNFLYKVMLYLVDCGLVEEKFQKKSWTYFWRVVPNEQQISRSKYKLCGCEVPCDTNASTEFADYAPIEPKLRRKR